MRVVSGIVFFLTSDINLLIVGATVKRCKPFICLRGRIDVYIKESIKNFTFVLRTLLFCILVLYVLVLVSAVANTTVESLTRKEIGMFPNMDHVEQP